MKRRIALIVEPHFMTHHVGVRNFIVALHQTLSRDASVDWVSYREQGSRRSWFRMQPNAPDVFEAIGSDDSMVIDCEPKKAMSQYTAKKRRLPTLGPEHFFKMEIGADLSREGYDIAFMTAPWIGDLSSECLGQLQVGFVLDTVPCEYSINRQVKPFEFANLHVQGFQFYQKECSHVIALSDATARSYNKYFGSDQHWSMPIPPLAPAMYHQRPSVRPSEPYIALSSPFDVRKGLLEMPRTLNLLTDQVDELRIYGRLRCTSRQAKQFFSSLDVKRVKWWPAASTAKVQEVLAGAAAMFFPSFEEGLGLPILEAQMCGCPAVVRNKDPMRQLLVGASTVFDSDGENAASALRAVIAGRYSRHELQEAAYNDFSPDRVNSVFWDILNDSSQRSMTRLAG